jgi:PAS domain S-box-containing protein
MRLALESGDTVVVEDPGRTCSECPLDCPYEDQTVLRRALAADGRRFGVIGVSLPGGFARDSEELELFEEVAGDLAFALKRMADEEELRVSRIRYREIFQGSRDGYVMVSADGRILDANMAYCEMLGYSLEELRELHDFYEITPPRWREWEQKEIWDGRLLTRGYSGLYEKEYIRRDGTVFPVELQAYAVRDESGEIDYLWGVARDITDRRRAQRELRESERRFRRVLEDAPFPVMLHAEDGEVLALSRAWTDITGYSLEEIPTTDRWVELAYGPRAGEVREVIGRLYSLEGRVDEGEFEVACSDGTTRIWAFSSASMPPLPDGRSVAVSMAADVTDRRRTEEQLTEAEEHYRSLFENTLVGIGLATPEGEVVETNAAFAEMLGYRTEEVVGRDVAEFYVRQEDRRSLREAVDEHGELRDFRTELLDSAGEPVCVLLSVSGIEVNGRPLYQTVCQDITEQVRAEEELRRKREMLERTERIARVGSWEWDLESGRMECSEELFRILGRRLDMLDPSMSGESDPIVPEDYDRLREAVHRCISDGTPYELDFRIEKPDGEIRHCSARGNLVEEAGGVRKLVGSLQDITDRVEVEEELRRSRERYKGLFNSALFGITLHDTSGMVIAANHSAEEIFGLTEEELRKKDLDFWRGRLLREDGGDMDLEEFPVSSVMSSRAPLEKSTIGLRMHPDEAVRWFLHSAEPMLDENGELSGVTTCFIDITESVRAERERERLQAQLNQAQRMESVGRLAGGVAHDFNNMLNVILGRAELALVEMEEDHPLRESISEIQNAARHSADLTRQLLAFARRQTVAPRVIDLNETLESLLSMLGRLIGEGIELAWKPGDGIEPVCIDPGQVDQLMTNLVVNARDAIEGVGRIVIETGLEEIDDSFEDGYADLLPGRYAVLTVSDDGCGMDDETMEHIFEPFFTSKESGEGTGLGLATVYGIVRQNGGFINVYSEPGSGSTFRIYLPVHGGEEETGGPQGTVAAVGGTETVLLAEDEPAILRMTQTMLEHLGYRVLSAGSPEEAIRLAGEYPGDIDLLLSDVVMPQMNGLELYRRLESIHPGLRSLFMSGYTADVIADHGVLERGTNFMQKPFSVDQLATKVRQALSDAEAGR